MKKEKDAIIGGVLSEPTVAGFVPYSQIALTEMIVTLKTQAVLLAEAVLTDKESMTALEYSVRTQIADEVLKAKDSFIGDDR